MMAEGSMELFYAIYFLKKNEPTKSNTDIVMFEWFLNVYSEVKYWNIIIKIDSHAWIWTKCVNILIMFINSKLWPIVTSHKATYNIYSCPPWYRGIKQRVVSSTRRDFYSMEGGCKVPWQHRDIGINCRHGITPPLHVSMPLRWRIMSDPGDSYWNLNT